MRIDVKTPRQETKETLKMLIKNYHAIHPEKGYRALRKDIFNDTGWMVSIYLMYQCFREMGVYSKARTRAFRRPKGVSDKFPNVFMAIGLRQDHLREFVQIQQCLHIMERNMI
ncbi:MAG: hypothetical protein PHW22_01405 [Bacilli bacterium]|nr:hypothetical protein [Bacilli bacterium]